MLFNPTARQTNGLKMASDRIARNVGTDGAHGGRASARRRGRRLACLGFAVAVALPYGSGQISRLYADDSATAPSPNPNTPPNLSNTDLLKLGITQYDSGQFEEADATLQQVDPKALSDQDRRTLVDALSKADEAANQRRAARAAPRAPGGADRPGRAVYTLSSTLSAPGTSRTGRAAGPM